MAIDRTEEAAVKNIRDENTKSRETRLEREKNGAKGESRRGAERDGGTERT